MRASLHVSRTTRVLYADTLESGWWAGVPQEENVSLSSARARVPPWPAPRPRARARRRPRSEQALLPRRARGPRRRDHHGGRGLLRRRRALRERRRGADDRVPPGLPGERPRGRPRLPRGGPRGRRSRQRRPRRAPVPPRLLRRLPARPRRKQRRSGLPRTVASLGVLRRGRAGGRLTPGRGRQRHRRGAPAGPLGSLREPSSALPVLEDDDVASRLEQHLEVAPPYRLLRPPAVDHPPLLADSCNRDSTYPCRQAVLGDDDEHGPRLVQSSRGTRIALLSGMRDHGATSTTVPTASMPAAARTWRSPSRSRSRRRLPRGRTSSPCVPADSVSSPSSSRSSAVGAGSSASRGASASRRRSGSPVGRRARPSVSSFAIGSGKERVSASSEGGRRGSTPPSSSAFASRQASTPSVPNRSATPAPRRRASSPRRLTPSSASSSRRSEPR